MTPANWVSVCMGWYLEFSPKCGTLECRVVAVSDDGDALIVSEGRPCRASSFEDRTWQMRWVGTP